MADTKYKIGTHGTPSREDAYQALSYARALGVRHCALLYPDAERSRRFVVTDGENEIATDGVVLSRPIAEIESMLAQMVQRLVRLGSSKAAANR